MMDINNFEDMLFGLTTPTDCPDYPGSEISEDDMLDDQEDDDSILWGSQESTLLTPVGTDYKPEEVIRDDGINAQDREQTRTSTAIVRAARDRFWVIARIEAMLERLVDGLLDESESLTISLKSRSGLCRRRANAVGDVGQTPKPKQRDINFPGATVQEAWTFS
jgi:meiotic recombination protein SPO11